MTIVSTSMRKQDRATLVTMAANLSRVTVSLMLVCCKVLESGFSFSTPAGDAVRAAVFSFSDCGDMILILLLVVMTACIGSRLAGGMDLRNPGKQAKSALRLWSSLTASARHLLGLSFLKEN